MYFGKIMNLNANKERIQSIIPILSGNINCCTSECLYFFVYQLNITIYKKTLQLHNDIYLKHTDGRLIIKLYHAISEFILPVFIALIFAYQYTLYNHHLITTYILHFDHILFLFLTHPDSRIYFFTFHRLFPSHSGLIHENHHYFII